MATFTITSAILNLYVATNQSIHFQLKNTNGIWSVPRSIAFTGTSVNRSAFVSYVEYFIGSDHGAGNVTSVSITSAANVPFNLSSVSLSQGEFVHLRVKDDQGRWSAPAELMYLARSIAAAEVVIGNNPNVVTLGHAIPMMSISGSYGNGIITAQANEVSWNYLDTIWVRARTSQYLWSKLIGGVALVDTILKPDCLFAPSSYDTVQVFYPPRPLLFFRSKSTATNGLYFKYSFHVVGSSLDTTIVNLFDTPLTTDHMLLLKVSSIYRWAVSAADGYSVVASSDSFLFRTLDKITSVQTAGQLLKAFALYQNYPNTFNPSTKIQYQLSIAAFVTLKIYDVPGEEVATLASERQTPRSSKRAVSQPAFTFTVLRQEASFIREN